MTGISSITYVGQIQGKSQKQIYTNYHRTFDDFSAIIIHTTIHDYTTKPQAVVQNYFRNQLHDRETKHCKKNLFEEITVAEMNCCKVVVEAAIWVYNHADVYYIITLYHQNIGVSVSLITSFFCFEKLLLTWNSRFLLK